MNEDQLLAKYSPKDLASILIVAWADHGRLVRRCDDLCDKLAQLGQQRDEARRMVCETRAVCAWSDEGCPAGFADGSWQRRAARELGWDCYETEGRT